MLPTRLLATERAGSVFMGPFDAHRNRRCHVSTPFVSWRENIFPLTDPGGEATRARSEPIHQYGVPVSRLVVVSNRTADPRKAAAGGLAVAVEESLQETGGLWFGWSGKIRDEAEPAAGYQDLRVQTVGNVTLATMDLSQRDYDTYYLGYANDVLWPVFHYRLDLANFDVHFAAGYRRAEPLVAHNRRTHPNHTVLTLLHPSPLNHLPPRTPPHPHPHPPQLHLPLHL